MRQTSKTILASVITPFLFSLMGCSDEKTITIKYPDGSLKESYIVDKSEKRIGPCTRFYPNGDTVFKCYYSSDLRNGPYQSYYLGNRKKSFLYYENGLRQGDFYFYDSLHGNIIRKGKYIDDKLAGIFRKYADGGLTELIQMYNDSVIWGVSRTAKSGNGFEKVENYLEMKYRDSIDIGEPFIAEIQVKNCTFKKIVFYEGKFISSNNIYKLIDTSSVVSSLNDSVIVFRINKPKRGRNVFTGILRGTLEIGDTVLYYPYIVTEQFFVK